MAKAILLVITGSSRQQHVLKHIKTLGHRLIILEKEKNWAQEYANDWIIADTNKNEDYLNTVAKYHRKTPFDGIITFVEMGVEPAAKISEKLKLPGIPFLAAQTCRHKDNFRAFCLQQKISDTRFKVLKTPADLEKIQTKLAGHPIVVKPTSSFLSQNVEILPNPKHLTLKKHQHYLVEEFVMGNEVDVDVLVQNGHIKFFSVSDNQNGPLPYCQQILGSIPTRLSAKAQKLLRNNIQQLIASLRLNNGCFHIEAIIEKSSVHLVEANLRMGGAETLVFNQIAYQVDLIEQSLNIATGTEINSFDTTVPQKHLIAHAFFALKSGSIANLKIDHTAISTDPHIEEFYFPLGNGDPVLAPPEGYLSLGRLVVSGPSRKEAESNLRAALKHIHYTIE